jgi:hypothetical protein
MASDGDALAWAPANDDLLPVRAPALSRRRKPARAAEPEPVEPEPARVVDVELPPPPVLDVELPPPPVLDVGAPPEPEPRTVFEAIEPEKGEIAANTVARPDEFDLDAFGADLDVDLGELPDVPEPADLDALPYVTPLVSPPPLAAPSTTPDAPAIEQEFWHRGLAPLHDFSDVRALPERDLDAFDLDF